MSSGTTSRQKFCDYCKEIATNSSNDPDLVCSSCGRIYHAKGCLTYSDRLISVAKTYDWICGSCKACEICSKTGREKDIILCDDCDRGYHCFCLSPPLDEPPAGTWLCPNCNGATKENVEHAPVTVKADRRILRRSRRANSRESESTATPDRDEPPPKKLRRNGSPHKIDARPFSSPRLARSLTSSPAYHRKRNHLRHGASRILKCPINGCNGDGHISGRFEKHSYRQFCPIYHGITIEETKELYKKRLELFEEQKAFKKPDTAQQQAALRSVDEERSVIESRFKKKPSNGARVINSSTIPSPRQFRDRAPPLANYVSKFDQELFRIAQAEVAEQMELNPSIRITPSTRIKWIRFGRYTIATWYISQFPGEFGRLEKLYMCEYCLKYMKSEYQLRRHSMPGHCQLSHPPGEKVYAKGNLAIWEVDGKDEKAYCQNLCLLAMLFLNQKTLYQDVEDFHFYILTLKDKKSPDRYHLTAYFSKEKVSHYNLSCILTLPPYLRRGYGHFLIDFSYTLSKLEGKLGSPEHPLSDMGLKAYRNYWLSKVFDWMLRSNDAETICIKDLSKETAIHTDDLISTLQYFGLVKYWRGQYWILKTDKLQAYKKSLHKKKSDPLQAPKDIDPSCLNWQEDDQE